MFIKLVLVAVLQCFWASAFSAAGAGPSRLSGRESLFPDSESQARAPGSQRGGGGSPPPGIRMSPVFLHVKSWGPILTGGIILSAF